MNISMRDSKISYSRIQLLHPAIRSEVLNCINEAETHLPVNAAIRVVQTLRTIEEQNELYAQGRTKPGKVVTNAKGGSSYHNYGLALDWCIIYDLDKNGTFETISWDIHKDVDCDGDPDWMEIIDVFKKYGYESGADFKSIKDYPHVQKVFGFNWRELLKRYNENNFIEGTKYVSLEK